MYSLQNEIYTYLYYELIVMECVSLAKTKMVFNNVSLISFVGSRSLYRKGHSWSETVFTWSSSWGQNCVISGPWCYGKGYGRGQIWWTAKLADGDPKVWTKFCGPVRSCSGYICHHNSITLSCYFSIFMDFFKKQILILEMGTCTGEY